jgi:uncharacterized protein YjbI with pentapeptide repeats
MANEEQLAILRQGVEVWNKWRKDQRWDLQIDLRGANLTYANLREADLSDVDLSDADLSYANLIDALLSSANLRKAHLYAVTFNKGYLNGAHLNGASLRSANLTHANFYAADLSDADLTEAHLSDTYFKGAHLTRANLTRADLEGANLSEAYLFKANLSGADFSSANLTKAILAESILVEARLFEANLSGANLDGADLTKANLRNSNMVGANVEHAIVSGSYVYGISVWDLEGEFKEQKDLIITPKHQSPITVDSIKVAQFIYLLLNNKEVRDVINTLTSKTVLILGRFAIPERKAILDALRNKLREYDLLPIVFDFDRPTDKDFTETIKTLAGISYFVIADVTNPKSSPLELEATVPDYQIPFVPIIQEGESPFAMMVDLQKKYPWVVPTRSYDSIETLMTALKPGIIDPAVEMRNKLRLIKAQEHPIESLKDYLDKSL